MTNATPDISDPRYSYSALDECPPTDLNNRGMGTSDIISKLALKKAAH